MDSMIVARALNAADAGWKEQALRRVWGDTVVARLGRCVDALGLDGFVAEAADGQRLGLLTYAVEDGDFEVVTLSAEREGIGVGRALMDAARHRATEVGARRMWLTTTNANARAFRFYQRWGMDLAALHRNGTDRSRLVKPSIPLCDPDGVPLRHELEFELLLAPRPAQPPTSR